MVLSGPTSFAWTAVIDGQPVTTFDQSTADRIGPIVMAAGPNPAAVAQVLIQFCRMQPAAANALLAALPKPLLTVMVLGGLTGVVDVSLTGLVAALSQAGAQLLLPSQGHSPAWWSGL